MVVKTFRGLLADGAQERIPLGTIKGKVGYRIVKFEIVPTLTGSIDAELVAKIYKTLQTAVNGDVNFSDNDLLGMAYFKINQTDARYGWGPAVIFDQEVFNQDIFITAVDTNASNNTNYYLELEQFPLASDEATVATLKDIKLNA